MHTISLNDGESHSVSDEGLLKVRVFPVGGSQTDLRISVSGENVRSTTPNNTLAIVTAVPASASISISPASGGDFGIDQAVRLTVSAADGTTVEFPVVRVGGVPEKKLGRIDHSIGAYRLTAFGSSVATDLPRSVMAVSSALRAHFTTTPDITGVRVFVDTAATLHQDASREMLAATATIIRGLATTFSLDEVELYTGAGRAGEVTVAELDGLMPRALEEDRTRVGAASLPPTPDKPGTIAVHITPTPVNGMVSASAASLILALSPGAEDEAALYSTSPDRTACTCVLPVSDQLATALIAGDSGAFNHGASGIARILESATEVSA